MTKRLRQASKVTKKGRLRRRPCHLTIRSSKLEQRYFEVQFLASQWVVTIKDHRIIGDLYHLHLQRLAILKADLQHAAEDQLVMVRDQVSFNLGNHFREMGTVAIFMRYHDLAALALPQPDNRLVKTGDHLPNTNSEFQGFMTFRRVEDRTVSKATDVINTHLVTVDNGAVLLITHQFAPCSTLISSTSNNSVELGPMSCPAPRSPYANSAGIDSCHFAPGFISCSASDHPGI